MSHGKIIMTEWHHEPTSQSGTLCGHLHPLHKVTLQNEVCIAWSFWQRKALAKSVKPFLKETSCCDCEPVSCYLYRIEQVKVFHHYLTLRGSRKCWKCAIFSAAFFTWLFHQYVWKELLLGLEYEQLCWLRKRVGSSFLFKTKSYCPTCQPYLWHQ